MSKRPTITDADVTRFPDAAEGVRDMRRALKTASPRAKVLLVIADPVDEVQADGGRPPYRVQVYANTDPVKFLMGTTSAIEEATDRWRKDRD